LSSARLKRAAAEAALAYVEPGMRLGLGTGSTASEFVSLLGQRVRAGLEVTGVPTSEATELMAEGEGIPLTSLDEHPELDLCVDGADAIDGQLRLVKGAGGALLREKIVAAASRHMIVIADASKRVERLGRLPLPVEIVRFGAAATRRAILGALRERGHAASLTLREADGKPYLTDGGNLIVDLHLGEISAPEALAEALSRIPGVVEHGLFIGIARTAILAHEGGIEVVTAEPPGGARPSFATSAL